MAEVVGLAASIAGLVAITGQIGKSILFIKGFLEDTKNAPDEIRSLANEIELLGSAAKKADALLVKCQADGLDIDLEEERKGLTRYADMIERLRLKIEKDVKTFGAGKGRWWERVGSAARKKSLDGYLVGVERAKTLVLGIETKIMIQLQHGHRNSLITTNESLETLQVSSNGITATLNKMETQTTQISAWTGITDQTLVNLSTGIEQINTSINTLLPTIENLHIHSSRPTELSALESMLESAVMRGMKRHHEELQKSQPSSSHHSPPETHQDYTDTSSEDNHELHNSGSYAMIRRDKTVFQTAFRTPFFDIEIETKEAQRIPKPKNGTPLHEVSRLKPTHSQRFTTYNVRVKIPFWRGGMTFHSGNAGIIYGGSLCKTFRTYNFVPYDAPIIEACENFDLPEVRRLFEAGLASPLDYNYLSNCSLVDTILCKLAWSANDFDQSSLSRAIDLLRYLIRCFAGDIGGAIGVYSMFHETNANVISPTTLAARAEAVRLAIMHSSDDPLTSLLVLLTIKISRTPLYHVLMAQDKWWVDDGIWLTGTETQKYWNETDLQMLKDPDGLSLAAAVEKGFKYRPYHFYYEFPVDGCLYALLATASETVEDDLHNCVHSRLVIMLNSGVDPRGVFFVHNLWASEPPHIDRPMSCTEYAQYLNLSDLWRRALDGAGWSNTDIDELFEEDLSHATTALLNGEIEYQSRDDNRRWFIEDLRRGKFEELEKDAIWTLTYQLEFELGLASYEIRSMIKEVTSILKVRKTPGSWLDEKDSSLMPGKDFKLPRPYDLYEDVKDWHCIREIWENELGGIPEGYAGNKYDYRLEQWI